jgi:glucose/mannose-6-phosphate isomerase
MLDDLKLIHERDADDALGIAEKQPAQLTQEFELKGGQEFSGINNVVYAGMGGSALAATLVHSWPKVSIPFEVVRDYELPAYVNAQTLVIAASYSGNTEETLSALAQAEEKGAQIAVIAGGGKLQAAAEEKGYLLGVLPKVVQPRYAVLSNFKLLLDILTRAGVLQGEYASELQQASNFLAESIQGWLPTVPTAQNQAKQLAQEVLGKSVVIYGGPKLFPAAYKWKISFNENAKQVAWAGQYPEFNHNEFIGWSKQPIDKPYCVIDLRSNLENPRVQKRFEVSERLLSGMRPAPEVVTAQGETVLEQLLWTIALGDFVSLYTGIANGLNPAPVELVEKFKKELDA